MNGRTAKAIHRYVNALGRGGVEVKPRTVKRDWKARNARQRGRLRRQMRATVRDINEVTG